MVRQQITFALLLHNLRRSWRAVTVFMLLGAMVVGTWQAIVGRQYEASVVVALAADSRAGSGLASIVGQMGSIASLIGAAGLGSAQRPEPLAVLQSRFLATRFVSERKLLQVLYWRRWNATAQQWAPGPLSRVPTLWDASEYFRKKVCRVSQDAKTGLTTVTVSWRNAAEAATWANELVAMTNQYLRDKEMNEAQRNVDYLTGMVAKAGLVEVRSALASLIQQEVQRVMIVQGTSEFAFKVIDAATPPEKPVPPGLLLSILLGALGGLFLAILYVITATRLRLDTSQISAS